MKGRLRPKGQRPAPQKQPGPQSLHNPYGRYFTAPRSFEQLVRAARSAPDAAATEKSEK